MKSVFSFALVAALLATSIPAAYALQYDNPINASRARCDRVSGRERDRCNFVNNRIERLRFRQANSAVERTNTLRDRRRILDNRPSTNVRRIGNFDLLRLRRHSRDGGNARRMLRLRNEQSRNACRNLEGTEKYRCIRRNNRQTSRGQTR